MVEYRIHKGTSRMVEFMGLRAQYFTAFFLGIAIIVFLFLIMRMILPPLLVGTVAMAALGALVWYCFTFNKKYGQHGLQKKQARSYVPRFVSNRKSFFLMLKKNA